MTSLIERWIRPQIRALSAYHVPEAAKLIKLDAMENPYSWPQPLVEEWLGRLRDVGLNRYPDPQASQVKQQLREVMGIPETQELILGNGSDELIQIITMAVAEPGRVVLAPEPSFVMYRLIAAATGMRFVGVPLKESTFDLDMQGMQEAIERHQPAVLFLAYPNNPTGNLWSREMIEEILHLAPGLVVVDEAYAPFASDTFIDQVGRYENLLVMRTISKMGLAGLRLGLVTGSDDWLTHLNKIRLPYNINVLTQVTAEFALHHRKMFDEQAAQIRADRQRLFERLDALPGIEPFPSEANFILFRTPASRANKIFTRIKRQGVLIKDLSGQFMLDDCLRVTVGKPEENEAFLQALTHALG